MSGYEAAMLMRCFLFTCLVFLVKTDSVIKKLCKDVDSSLCTIHTVIVDPCQRGPAFCVMKTKKNYGLTLNLTPHFSAERLKLGMYGDVSNNSTFNTVIKVPDNGCHHLTCPLRAEERRLFDVDLILDKRASGKFPVKVKLWNEENEAQACCFTFSVKVK